MFEIVVLSEKDYWTVIQRLAALGITGGAVYDALITQAAVLANVDQVLTLNAKDFRRVYPELADKIVVP